MQFWIWLQTITLFVRVFEAASTSPDHNGSTSTTDGLYLLQRFAEARIESKAEIVMERAMDSSFIQQSNAPMELTFVHIPKNAGTSIEEAGAAAGIWWPIKWPSFWQRVEMPISNGSDDKRNSTLCGKWHVPPRYLDKVGDSGAKLAFIGKSAGTTFCVSRNPYDRAVSEYLYMLTAEWGESMSEMFGTGLLDFPRCTEDGLNNFVRKASEKVRQGDRFVHDCHMVPQVDFIWDEENQTSCDHVIRFEELPGSFNDLMEAHGYAARLNASGHVNNATDACPGLSAGNLSNETKALLNEVYRDDFVKLNYTRV